MKKALKEYPDPPPESTTTITLLRLKNKAGEAQPFASRKLSS